MPRSDQFQKTTVSVPFAAGDATKTIVAAPGATKFLVVTYCAIFISTAAAQAVDVESSDAATELIKLPASFSGKADVASKDGYKLPLNTALRYQPAGAGPAGIVVVEYYIDGAF